ncbi:hypothetical protein [Rhodovastum atsumiense]|uniref:Lipoprotein n=1 Tax=Rhodovastum atsumiense TaxID=504468 RepID=A0A5M6ISC9_9PROT|nr:hypothetical protein [Rhodovastum atsumiense]KAA5611214.1 hypothetical protein F1189_15715 [Rhodovastum atsumiense]
MQRLALTLSLLLPATACNSLPPATAAQVAAWQGTYSGEAVINDAALPGPVCQPRVAIADFRVVGNQVEFGLFNGTIRDDGSVQMVNRQVWIMGRFEDGRFVGSMIVPPTEVCRYQVLLERGAA